MHVQCVREESLQQLETIEKKKEVVSYNLVAITKPERLNPYKLVDPGRSLGAQVLIDDNPRYAIECAEAGIKVLLFDYNDSYPWCKTGSGTPHPLVTKVYNWHEVERHLASFVMS